MSNPDLLEKQKRKLRRRIEDYLRHTAPQTLIRVADLCGIPVPKTLRDEYVGEDENSPTTE